MRICLAPRRKPPRAPQNPDTIDGSTFLRPIKATGRPEKHSAIRSLESHKPAKLQSLSRSNKDESSRVRGASPLRSTAGFTRTVPWPFPVSSWRVPIASPGCPRRGRREVIALSRHREASRRVSGILCRVQTALQRQQRFSLHHLVNTYVLYIQAYLVNIRSKNPPGPTGV